MSQPVKQTIAIYISLKAKESDNEIWSFNKT